MKRVEERWGEKEETFVKNVREITGRCLGDVLQHLVILVKGGTKRGDKKGGERESKEE